MQYLFYIGHLGLKKGFLGENEKNISHSIIYKVEKKEFYIYKAKNSCLYINDSLHGTCSLRVNINTCWGGGGTRLTAF